MTTLTANQVDALSILARLSLSAAEKRRYARELSAVLEYVAMLGEVDTSGVVETCQVTALEDVSREDKVISCDPETRKKLLALFPERVGDLLKTPTIFLC